MSKNIEYWHIRVTESFNRALLQENVKVRLTAENGKFKFTIIDSSSEKHFDSELDQSTSDLPLISSFAKDGNCVHLGTISARLRVAANSDSFDQLRANVLKVKEDSRKTSFRSWDTESLRAKRPSPVISRPSLHPSPRVMPYNIGSIVKKQNAKKTMEQYQRILEVIESAKKKRTELEERLANVLADKSLSRTQLEAVVAGLEEETCHLVKELLANEDLSSTIPPYVGGSTASRSPVSLADFLNHLREQVVPPTE
ncbi:hypothetical protein Aperf_G00000068002 [Anoplocephala perfoliata]